MFKFAVVNQKIVLCSEIGCCVLEKIVMFWKRLLCSENDFRVLKKVVVCCERLLCSEKDCCVSERKLSCVLPLWATVRSPNSVAEAGTLNLDFGVKKCPNRKIIFGTFIYALWSYQNRKHPVGHIDT